MELDPNSLPGVSDAESRGSNFAFNVEEEERENMIKFQLDTLLDTSRLIYALRGFVYDQTTTTWLFNNESRPLCNESGIAYILSQISIGKNILLSSYDKKDWNMNLRVILDDVSRTFYVRGHLYDLYDTTIMDSIIDGLIYTYLKALFGAAENGQMRVYLQKQIRETHTFSTNTNPDKKKGWF